MNKNVSNSEDAIANARIVQKRIMNITLVLLNLMFIIIIYMAFVDQSTIAYRKNGVTVRYKDETTLNVKNNTKEEIKISVYCDGYLNNCDVPPKSSREIHMYYGTNIIEIYQSNKSNNFEIVVKDK